VPANFHPDISKTVTCGRVLKFKKRNSSTFEATPPSPGGSGPKIFFAYFFPWSGAWLPQISNRSHAKKFGKNFPPGGSDPQNFWKSGCIPPRVMCMQIFIHISLKLWPVDVGGKQGDKNKKLKTDKVADVPPKPEVLSLWHMYHWIGLRALNLPPETVLL